MGYARRTKDLQGIPLGDPWHRQEPLQDQASSSPIEGVVVILLVRDG